MAFTAGQKLSADDLNVALAADDCEGEYNMAVNQSIDSAVSTPILFGTTNRSSTLITKDTSGVGSTFTVLRAGVWTMSATIRYEAGGTAAFTSSTIVISSASQAGSGFGNTSGLTICNPGIAAVRLTSGTVISVNAYHERGTSVSLTANNSIGLGRFYLAWLHP